MSFEDLPADWPTRPVTDPEITADLLDLVVRDSDRRTGAVAILLCGPTGRMVQPVVVALPPDPVTPEDRRRPFDVMCQALLRTVGEHADEKGDPGGLLVALARPGSVLVTADDRLWEDAAQASCDAYGVSLLGRWLVTPAAIRPLPATPQRRPA